MHKQTRLAMEEAMRVLRADPPLPTERRQKVARQLEIRIAAEHAEIDRRCALIRHEFEVEIRGPGGSSGRVNRKLSGIERSLPPGDRE